MTTESVWLTPTALQRLRDELASLNPHTAAPAELARIAELRALIARSEASTKPDDGLVEPGMRVTVRFEDDASTSEFILGSRALLGKDDSLDVAVYSPESPLGAAINGLNVGDAATIDSPKGTRSLTILAATPVA